MIPHILSWLYVDLSESEFRRGLSHYVGGGNPKVETLLQWIGEPVNNCPDLKSLTKVEKKNALSVFAEVWTATELYPAMRADLAQQITNVTQYIKKEEAKDLMAILQTHHDNLEKAGLPHSSFIGSKIKEFQGEGSGYNSYIKAGLLLFLGHLLFWVVLIWIYR